MGESKKKTQDKDKFDIKLKENTDIVKSQKILPNSFIIYAFMLWVVSFLLYFCLHSLAAFIQLKIGFEIVNISFRLEN